VGKSTLIETLGLHLIDQGHKVAVLAVDPSSTRSGGSILGDKTRMERLGREPNAFIRPSPSGGAVGGVARRTREALLVCEAAGFDVILVETVGVGQSETEVDEMVDVFTLLVSPGGGDDLQGIKRGVMELADIVVVTKADGALAPAARQAATDYQRALHLMRPKHTVSQPTVLLCSAVTGEGVDDAWRAITDLHTRLAGSGELERRRRDQARGWFWAEVRGRLVEQVMADPRTPELEDKVARGEMSPSAAAQQLLSP
jgi:LAO/AO transport system kinase